MILRRRGSIPQQLGEPGAGKSVGLNDVVAHTALSLDADLWLFDGKLVELGLWRSCAASRCGTCSATGGYHRHALGDRARARLGLRQHTAAAITPDDQGVGLLLAEGGEPRRLKAAHLAHLADEPIHRIAEHAAMRRLASVGRRHRGHGSAER